MKITDILPDGWRQRQRFVGLMNGVLLFLMLLIAIWLATQRREAPQLILLLLLYVITVNFSLPPVQGAVGLVPVVSVTSALMVDWETAVLLAAFSLVVAELARPLWIPVWESIDIKRPSASARLGRAVIYLLSLAASAWVYREIDGQIPLTQINTVDLYRFGTLALIYGGIYFLLSFLLWLMEEWSWRVFVRKHALAVLTAGLLAQPFALFGAAAFGSGGLPIFVIYCLSVMLVSVLIWMTWQQRHVLEQRLQQFRVLNSVGTSLRETLELAEVLDRTRRTMSVLIPADQYAVALLDDKENWYVSVSGDHQPDENGRRGDLVNDLASSAEVPSAAIYSADDFTRWVVRMGRALDLSDQNMHFAGRHELKPPDPRPSAWLGVPLQTVDKAIGALVVQRYPPYPSFNRWSREVLLAVAGQASAAIQNARLYQETVRLYNLTDEALAQRVKQLQALLDTMQEGVLMLDSEGRIVLVNTEAALLLGDSATELRQQVLDVDLAAAKLGYEGSSLEQLLELLQTGKIPQSAHFVFEARLPDDNGRSARRFIERTGAPVLAASQQIIGWLMLFRDVTEERELAEQRGDLTRMIVHDLRNPVSTFISNMHHVDSLLPADSGMQAAREAVADARQSGYDMLDMVDSLMDINRMEAGLFVAEVEAVNFQALAKRVVRRMQVVADQRQIVLSQHIEPELPLVWADEDMIRRVLINLLDNALKFTPSEGYVDCRVKAESTAETDRAPGIRCVVSDSGPGIPPEYRDEIFERFIRTNKGGAQIRGTGLGLAFCKLAIRAHGGDIWVANQEAGGSKFVFSLPGIPISTDQFGSV